MALNLALFETETCFSKQAAWVGGTMAFLFIVSKQMALRHSSWTSIIPVSAVQCEPKRTHGNISFSSSNLYAHFLVKALNPRYLKWDGKTSTFAAEFSFDSTPDEMIFGTGQHQVSYVATLLSPLSCSFASAGSFTEPKGTNYWSFEFQVSHFSVFIRASYTQYFLHNHRPVLTSRYQW